MAHCPRCVSQTKPTPIRSKDFLGFNSEVLKLWLGALNLPVMDSKGQLLNCLKRALLGNSGKSRSNTTANSKQQKWMSGRLHINAWPSWSTRKNIIDWCSTGETETFPPQQNSAVIASHKQEQEDNALSDHASLSSIEDMIKSDLGIGTNSQQNISFSSASIPPLKKSCHVQSTLPWTPSPLQQALLTHSHPTRHVVLLVWLLLWVFLAQLTVFWRTKYSGVRLCFTITRQLVSGAEPWDPAPFGWLILRPCGFPGYCSEKEKICNWHDPEVVWCVYGLYASLNWVGRLNWLSTSK